MQEASISTKQPHPAPVSAAAYSSLHQPLLAVRTWAFQAFGKGTVCSAGSVRLSPKQHLLLSGSVYSPDGGGTCKACCRRPYTMLECNWQLLGLVCWRDGVTLAVQESGREGIAACALADGSSLKCKRCGGVVARARWQHHNAWCSGR